MHRHKSKRHQRAAQARWRAQEQRAQAQRDDGIPDRPLDTDMRQPFDLPLRHLGLCDMHLEPCAGKIAWRLRDADTGEVIERAALKTLLHAIADKLPRQLGARNF